MAIGRALESLLKSSPEIMSIVSDPQAIGVGAINQRVAYPHVRISTNGTDTMEDLEGSGGMEMPTVDFDCCATSKIVADQLASAVKGHIRNYKGTIGGHRIHAVIYDDNGDDEIPIGQGTQRILFVTTLTFQIQYT